MPDFNKGDFTQQGVNGHVNATVRLNEKRLVNIDLTSNEEAEGCTITGTVKDLLNDKVYGIGAGVSGNIEITENGENINVAPYATATVNVSGGGVQKNYVVPQNTTFTTAEMNGMWAHVFTSEGLFYADTLKAKIDGVDYTATYDSEQHAWLFSDSIAVTMAGTDMVIVFLSDTQATSHTVEIYYEGVETIYAMYEGDPTANSYCCAYENGVFNPHIEIPAGGAKMVTYPIVGNSKIINTGFISGSNYVLDTSNLIGGTATTDSDNYQLITPANNYFIVNVIADK